MPDSYLPMTLVDGISYCYIWVGTPSSMKTMKVDFASGNMQFFGDKFMWSTSYDFESETDYVDVGKFSFRVKMKATQRPPSEFLADGIIGLGKQSTLWKFFSAFSVSRNKLSLYKSAPPEWYEAPRAQGIVGGKCSRGVSDRLCVTNCSCTGGNYTLEVGVKQHWVSVPSMLFNTIMLGLNIHTNKPHEFPTVNVTLTSAVLEGDLNHNGLLVEPYVYMRKYEKDVWEKPEMDSMVIVPSDNTELISLGTVIMESYEMRFDLMNSAVWMVRSPSKRHTPDAKLANSVLSSMLIVSWVLIPSDRAWEVPYYYIEVLTVFSVLCAVVTAAPEPAEVYVFACVQLAVYTLWVMTKYCSIKGSRPDARHYIRRVSVIGKVSAEYSLALSIWIILKDRGSPTNIASAFVTVALFLLSVGYTVSSLLKKRYPESTIFCAACMAWASYFFYTHGMMPEIEFYFSHYQSIHLLLVMCGYTVCVLCSMSAIKMFQLYSCFFCTCSLLEYFVPLLCQELCDFLE